MLADLPTSVNWIAEHVAHGRMVTRRNFQEKYAFSPGSPEGEPLAAQQERQLGAPVDRHLAAVPQHVDYEMPSFTFLSRR